MEVLQCDGCDFRAESNDELKAHIQDVHTAFLQPTEVGEGDDSPRRSRSNSLNSLSQTEDEEDLSNHNYDSLKKEAGVKLFNKNLGHISGSKKVKRIQSAKPSNKTSTPFFQCKFCVRYFRSSSLLSEHTRKVHGEASDERSLKTYDGVGTVFSCQYCTYKSPHRARILKHQKMHHKEGLPGHSAPPVGAEVLDLHSDASSVEEQCEESPEDVERNVLESMIKPQSRGGFDCEWCGFQTSQRQQLADHMMKKHRNMVKIMVSLQQPKIQDGSAGSSKSDSASSRRSTPTSNLNLNDLACNEGSSANASSIKGSSGNASLKATSGISSFQYSQLTAKIPNSTGSSILSERSTFTMSDMSRSGMDLDASMLNDSRSSSDDELCDLDDPSYTESAEDSTKLLLSEEDNDLLETKGVPFKRHMNRFQCPFCSFLTMHRRSISRHIENIHLSGKATVYKCDKCPFLCTNPLKLDTHKQCHGGSSEWNTMDLTSESVDGPAERSVPVNGGNGSSKINGKKSSTVEEQQGPHRCSLCNFSTITLKGLRVHQQHKHSYCDGTQVTGQEGSSNEQQDSESESYSSSSFVQKTQTSILGFSTKKHLIGKTARKSINDLPLDLSPVKKRTRIDEIANNLQSKISQSQQHEDVINLEEMDDDVEENGNHIDLETSKERESSDARSQHYTFNTQHLHVRNSGSVQTERGVGKRKRNLQSKLGSRNIPVQVTISDDEDNYSASLESKDAQDQSSQDSRETYQDNPEYNTEEPGNLFYCKHCEYQNKSARSVSTHYQRMHPYIKFSFRYILDPEDQSAVFRCLECFIEYNNFNDLHQHYMTHHPEASNVLNFNQPDLVYMCRFCSYTSPNVRSLMPHYQRMHPSVKINNAMIFSSYMVDQPHKGAAESQTLREILNSGPKSFRSSSSGSRSSSSPAIKSVCKTPEANTEAEAFRESLGGNVVVYDCDVCSFSSPNMHSVLVHYQKKHPEQKASYFRIQKTMRVISVDQAQLSNNSTYSLTSTPKSSNVILPVALDEDVYYCKHCVYNNRSVVGVLVHYQKRHPEIKVTAKYIKQAPPTPGLLKLMDELQIAPPKQFLKQFNNNGTEGSGNSNTKGASDKGEPEMLFFCQHCDYGNRTVKGVLIHYQKKHRDVKANADLVRRHTAVVRSQRERAQMIQAGSSTSTATVATEAEKSRSLRSLKCRHCAYTSPYVYALKKHLKKDHPTVKATQEAAEMPVAVPVDGITNGDVEDVVAMDADPLETGASPADVTMETEEPVAVETEPMVGALEPEKERVVPGHPCSMCNRMFMSMQGLRSHERSHTAVALVNRNDKYSCQYCQFASPFRHNFYENRGREVIEIGKSNLYGPHELQSYFTVIYSKEAEKPPSTEEVEIVEVKDEVEPEGDVDWLPFKCLKCFKLSFSAAELLVVHYNDCHDKELKRDFVTIPSPAEDGMELYQCTHCEIKFLTLPELCVHLINHNEDFQKRAMRLERRKQLQSKQRTTEPPEAKPENKVDGTPDKTPIGYRCNFCVEVHSTLRAICNHLRKHVQYGEAKEGHVKQEAAEMPVAVPVDGITNGDVEDVVAMDADPLETGASPADVTMETEEPVAVETEPMVGALEPEKERVVPGHPCSMCNRMFMSMQGLRSHERSHTAVALVNRNDKYSCQYCQFASPFRHNLDRHVQSHHGHQKPFRCKFCPFKSSYLSRLKSHLHKAHAGETLHTRTHITLMSLAAVVSASAGYLEPADVQQQLSHFQLASRVQADVSSSPPPPLESPVPQARPDSILTCEFCEFSSGYMQSLRRHYRDRHGGKKLFKCKDCSFFTCYKSTFTLHVEAGHTSGPEETPKDLRCPFCLYHTKHKSSMIDHIVLHREERVVPLEVSRSKLSRHLEGLVFRCHKCTFTCSSEPNLQQHIQKHEELKPYQCQLCYYDSKLLHELETHLRQEHKVIRNFELVGRVNLDQLEMKDKTKDVSSSEEEEEEEEEKGEDETVEEADEEEEEELMEDEEEEKLPESRQETTSSQTEVTGNGLHVPEKLQIRFAEEIQEIPIAYSDQCYVFCVFRTVNGSKNDGSPVPSSALPLIGPAAVSDRGLDLSSNTVDQSDQSKCPIQTEEDKETQETKNDP
ncbi:zinc finger protein 462-like [Sinocyclocheilus grahami]|uniref:zinc finger protein 462-like n=1 Tax=Sinocyclocheilus grahami TaxID=75366 RepID=UPI0007ACA9C0|nr:PREDICTED: zinc finger protein 462-like [Sinocyclocheilus grahami]